VGRRDEAAAFRGLWSGLRESAAATLSSTDGRWALVSTSITALIAGSIAFLAAGTAPGAGTAAQVSANRALLPYQLFLKLAARSNAQASYAGFGPAAGPVSTPPAAAQGDASSALDDALTAEQLNEDQTPASDTRTVTLDKGDTLVGALMDAGVADTDADAVVVALQHVYDTRSLRTGQSFELTFAPADNTPTAQITYTPPSQAADSEDDDSASAAASPPPMGKLLSVTFSPTVDHEITIARGTDDSFTANDVQKELAAKYHHAGGTIDSSLYLAAMRAGIPADVVVDMIHMFSYQVDFQRDIHPGDKFEVLYDYYYTKDGQPAKQGNIAYAAMTLGGHKFALYRYDAGDGDGADYFDAKGQSAKGFLMKTPVDGARITSGFGMRFHPVLGYSRMHKGVDFGVPVGTPVMAAGSGTIQFEGHENGYGNFLLIKHTSEYSTAYAHLSRFVPGLHIGSHVRQGQVVAYSGNTGLTTGPHLHYEVRIDGKQVNPMTVKVAHGRQLAGRELREFKADRVGVDDKLASMPLETKVADNTSTDLRAGKD